MDAAIGTGSGGRGRWDVSRLRRRYQGARPFPHLVLDGLLEPHELPGPEAFSAEPLVPQTDELFSFRVGPAPPLTPPLRRLAEQLGAPAMLADLRAITGLAVGRVEARAYAYGRGHYLLPHTDWRPGWEDGAGAAEKRLLAFAWYLGRPEPVRGGALELFACAGEGGQLTAATPVKRISPRVNRLVLFAVSPLSLHQVREVISGERLSLAGWLLP